MAASTEEFALMTRAQFEESTKWWIPEPVPFFDAPDEKWWDYVCQNENVLAFSSSVSKGGELRVACYSQTDVEWVDNSQSSKLGWIAIVTSPDFQRQGIASRHMAELELRLRAEKVSRLIALIAEANEPSKGFFLNQGFTNCGQAEDDPKLLHYEKSLK